MDSKLRPHTPDCMSYVWEELQILSSTGNHVVRHFIRTSPSGEVVRGMPRPSAYSSTSRWAQAQARRTSRSPGQLAGGCRFVTPAHTACARFGSSSALPTTHLTKKEGDPAHEELFFFGRAPGRRDLAHCAYRLAGAPKDGGVRPSVQEAAHYAHQLLDKLVLRA
jgi:hypothetical protein